MLVVLALMSALALSISAPAGAEETEGVKNLTVPLLFAETDGADDLALWTDTTTGTVEGTKTYPADDPMYYVVTDPNVHFGAQRATATAPVAVIADWGDNLTNHSFRGNLKQPIRVEMALWGTGTMTGYEPVLLEGSRGTEVYGITGAISDLTPLVYTTGEWLTIQALDGAGDPVGDPLYAGPMTAEVNAAGKVIYGFNWGTPSGVPSPTKGAYRLTFTVPDTVQITGVGAADLFVPKVVNTSTTTLDIIIGNAPGRKPTTPGDSASGGGGIGAPPHVGGGGGGGTGQGPGGPR